MPISSHFQDCKALLALSLSHVRSALARAGLFIFLSVTVYAFYSESALFAVAETSFVCPPHW